MHDEGGGAPVIRVVRKKHHEEHHGGAWKVAYADFVTAMMAFFLVMWVVGMDQPAKDAVQAYFRDPMGSIEQLGAGAGVMVGASGIPLSTQTAVMDMLRRRHLEEQERLEGVAERLRASLGQAATEADVATKVAVEVTQEGLRVELVEAREGESTFFDVSSARLTPGAERVLGVIASELADQANFVIVEGHTDSRPSRTPDYTNWELSNDRANAARRALERTGLDPLRVQEVRGYADRRLAYPDDPQSPANRRVSILLPYINELPVESATEGGIRN